MFCEIYPQSAAHITTIHECFTILQFTDLSITRPRSSIPVPDFRLPILRQKSESGNYRDTHKNTKVSFIVASKRLGTRLEFRWKPFWKRAGDDYNFWIRRISQRLGNVCSSETMGRSSSKHKV